MSTSTVTSDRLHILALVPFLVQGSLSLTVLRAMRDRGMGVSIAFYLRGGGGYTMDPCADFASTASLIDMSKHRDEAGITILDAAIRKERIGLVLQIGAVTAYRQMPYLKELNRNLRILDVLYDKLVHTTNHFLYEACFDGVLVQSLDMQNFVLACTSKADPGVRKVESGIDLERFGVPQRPLHDGLTVGFIGRMSPEKNPLGFVNLAERLHATSPRLSFRLFGEGELAQEVRARIASSDAADAIRYEGYVTDQRAALATVDVLIVPSVFDGRPTVIMEANACGVPVIGAPVGAIPELIEPGCNGFVLGPQDHDAVAEVLRTWMAEPSSFQRMRTSSRATAEARFDQRFMFDAYEAVFREFV